MENKEGPNTVIIHESSLSQYAQQIIIGNHILTADEPVAVGGADAGPSPYDFLLAGLGACTSMTLRMYANLKKIPVKNIIVKLSHEKVYSKDCENCEDSHSKIDKIERHIELQGELSEEQQDKLLDIANKCPVHRTLTSKILINTVLMKV